MKTLTTIIILLTFNNVVLANKDVPEFSITSDCAVMINIKNIEYTPGWTVIININKSAANKLLNFSNTHLKKQVRFTNGDGIKLGKRNSMLQTSVSSQLHITGLNTESEASEIKESILSTTGMCNAK